MASGAGHAKATMSMRVAAAIGWPCLNWGGRKMMWQSVTHAERQALLVSAAAVLSEMRNPTPRMRRAACGAMSPGKRPTEERVSSRAKHGIRYRAMIDAALDEDAISFFASKMNRYEDGDSTSFCPTAVPLDSESKENGLA